jgi:hypothetical protein
MAEVYSTGILNRIYENKKKKKTKQQVYSRNGQKKSKRKNFFREDAQPSVVTSSLYGGPLELKLQNFLGFFVQRTQRYPFAMLD